METLMHSLCSEVAVSAVVVNEHYSAGPWLSQWHGSIDGVLSEKLYHLQLL